ncbi:hypothetical protein C8R45DRAFT_935048 [Mycena sanguinolenta]|nr:hypothetical protein C8R45DRAFT_935048 [Mycena sanguinolenta]
MLRVHQHFLNTKYYLFDTLSTQKTDNKATVSILIRYTAIRQSHEIHRDRHEQQTQPFEDRPRSRAASPIPTSWSWDAMHKSIRMGLEREEETRVQVVTAPHRNTINHCRTVEGCWWAVTGDGLLRIQSDGGIDMNDEDPMWN